MWQSFRAFFYEEFKRYNICRIFNTMSRTSINWDKVIGKKARGLDNADLGEVQEVLRGIVVTEKELEDRNKFYFPQALVDRFDGDFLLLNVSRLEAEAYRYS
jgi:hypothetical protein